MKNPTFAPMYASLFVVLSEIARDNGYALTIHGTLNNDFDLVAIPWTKQAVNAEQLVNAIASYVSSVIGANHDLLENLPSENKPHGRIAWSIPMGAGAVIDLSVMPRLV